MAKTHLFFSRPADRSLEAYKAWIHALTAHLGGTDDLSEAEWDASWRQFWNTADGEPNVAPD